MYFDPGIFISWCIVCFRWRLSLTFNFGNFTLQRRLFVYDFLLQTAFFWAALRSRSRHRSVIGFSRLLDPCSIGCQFFCTRY